MRAGVVRRILPIIAGPLMLVGLCAAAAAGEPDRRCRQRLSPRLLPRPSKPGNGFVGWVWKELTDEASLTGRLWDHEVGARYPAHLGRGLGQAGPAG